MSLLFEPFQVGRLTLPNRIAMAPMTRSRALDNAPNADTATYYAQRASAGLIISEGVVVSEQARGYLWTPGIHTEDQIAKWQDVTQAVHGAGGRIYAQLWHVGRMSHVSFQPGGALPVSSVNTQVSAEWPVFAFDENGEPGQIRPSPARRLEIDEIREIIEDFVHASENAIAAGFDGVELHSAGAYLFDQFINEAINKREDEYGGVSIENRLRFLLETVDAISDRIGHQRIAVRVSPEGRLKDGFAYPSEHETFLQLAAALSQRQIAYLHINDRGISRKLLAGIRNEFKRPLMITGELTKHKANELLDSGLVDLVGFGRLFIGNPDLVERLLHDWPLVDAEKETYYGGDSSGYIDFPPYASSAIVR